MSYLLQNNKNRNSKSFFSSGIFIFFVSLFLLGTLFFSFFGSSLGKMAGTFSPFFQKIIFVDYFKSKNALIEENISLKNNLNELSAQNADRQSLVSENERLNQILGRGFAKNAVLAKVLSKPGFSPYDVFVLDIGENKGVVSGDKVVFGNLVIGKIEEVSKNSSKARLFSSSGNKFSAILGDTKNEIEVEGKGGGGFEALLPTGLDVKEGDPIVLPQISIRVFGFVKSILNEPGSVFQKVFFTLPININEVDFVYIEK